MIKLHSWEEVYSSRPIDGTSTLINRFCVPGGWIYVHTIMRSRLFRRHEVHISTVYVPDPSEETGTTDLR
jgi:hypothetical protein